LPDFSAAPHRVRVQNWDDFGLRRALSVVATNSARTRVSICCASRPDVAMWRPYASENGLFSLSRSHGIAPLQGAAQQQNDHDKRCYHKPKPTRDRALPLKVGHVHRQPQKAEGEKARDPVQRRARQARCDMFSRALASPSYEPNHDREICDDKQQRHESVLRLTAPQSAGIAPPLDPIEALSSRWSTRNLQLLIAASS